MEKVLGYGHCSLKEVMDWQGLWEQAVASIKPGEQQTRRSHAITSCSPWRPKECCSISQSLHFCPAKSWYAKLYEVWISKGKHTSPSIPCPTVTGIIKYKSKTQPGFSSSCFKIQTIHNGLTKWVISMKYYKHKKRKSHNPGLPHTVSSKKYYFRD